MEAPSAVFSEVIFSVPSLIVVVLILGGIQMLMMGVLGEYLWRALDESRRRPRYIVEDQTPARREPGEGRRA